MWWLLVVIIAIIYRIANRPYEHWTRKGVKQGVPIFPFGDTWKFCFAKVTIQEMVQILYNRHPKAKYTGIYQLTLPVLLIRDLDLIRQITVKDFDHFTDHKSFVSEEVDPLTMKLLFTLTGQKWKDMRNILSPAFTSSKMKSMFTIMHERSERFVEHFLQKNENIVTVEMKDTVNRLTTDIIADVMFGFQVDSLNDRHNELYTMGQAIAAFDSFSIRIKLLLPNLFPGLFHFFRIKIFSKKIQAFFTKLVRDNVASREQHGFVRPDLIHLMMEARKEPGEDTNFNQHLKVSKIQRKITEDDMVSQALLFFFAGFDAISTLVSFMSYELCINPDVQEKLRDELDATLEACNGKITYEALLGMKYMDMVVSETLRKWPTNGFVDRVCTKPYTIQPNTPEETPVHLEKGDAIWIPIYGLHRDPKYYPDPDRFDPERFNDENKVNIKPYTYIPFGSGPRICIAARYSLLKTKILLFDLLSHFEIVPVEKTENPLVFNKKLLFGMTAENGFWLGLKKRVK